MNLYVTLCSALGTTEASALGVRLAEWHDAMVAHERRLRTASRAAVCDDECPHAEAPRLWSEALAVLGRQAHELTFLRSRAIEARPGGRSAATPASVGEAAGDAANTVWR